MSAPWLDDGDVRLYHGSALEVLRSLPAGVAQTCVTSPPYWGLRDYGTGSWTGGAGDCDHLGPPMRTNNKPTNGGGTFHGGTSRANEPWPDGACGKCGARRVDDQLGLEATPDQYVERLVAVMREVWRVLRADGTLWLNLGDSYVSNGFWPDAPSNQEKATGKSRSHAMSQRGSQVTNAPGLKAKDLVGIPWRVAFALQADGWYLRSDIIWSKPNPMPESVTDRPTKAHEYVFLLAKQPRYYYDADAISEAANPAYEGRYNGAFGGPSVEALGEYGRTRPNGQREYTGRRNARSVWEIATQPTPMAHFATYPEALVRRCILAGTSEAGGCSVCGSPWVRVVERGESDYSRLKGDRDWRDLAEISAAQGKGVRPGQSENAPTHANHTMTERGTVPSLRPRSANHLGWEPSCSCSDSGTGSHGSGDAPGTSPSGERLASSTKGTPAPFTNARPVPQIVLDPFVGSGTTMLVARKHGRRAIGIDLSEEYLAIAARRTQQLSLLGDERVVRGGGAA